MKKDKTWAMNQVNNLDGVRIKGDFADFTTIPKDKAIRIISDMDEPEVLSQEWIDKHKVDYHNWIPAVPIDYLQNLIVPKQEEVDRAYKDGYEKGKQHTFYKGYLEGLAEGERKTSEYFESITEEPSYEQVQKYLSEHGIEVVEKGPETVADVIADFFKSLERLKEVMSMEIEELEE